MFQKTKRISLYKVFLKKYFIIQNFIVKGSSLPINPDPSFRASLLEILIEWPSKGMADARLAKRMMMIKTIVEDKLRWRISFSFSQLLWFASPSCNLCLNRSFLVGWPLWKVLWAPWSLFLTSNFRKFETSKVPPSLPEASDWRKTIFFFEKNISKYCA